MTLTKVPVMAAAWSEARNAATSATWVFALRHAADRIEERIGRLPASDTVLGQLRAVLAELLPLDTARREEALVWLAFIARATTDPSLAPEAEDVWRRFTTRWSRASPRRSAAASCQRSSTPSARRPGSKP